MTIKAFAEKYNIPYPLAFKASIGVAPVATLERDKDFPEDALFDGLIAVYTERKEYFNDMAHSYTQKIKAAQRTRKGGIS